MSDTPKQRQRSVRTKFSTPKKSSTKKTSRKKLNTKKINQTNSFSHSHSLSSNQKKGNVNRKPSNLSGCANRVVKSDDIEKENQSFGVRYLTIEEAFSGQRIDNYLRRILPSLPKSRLYQMVRKGEVRLNKKRVKVETRVNTGDILRLPPTTLKENTTPNIPDTLIKQIQNAVLHIDDDFLVINKPAGLAVHGGSSHHYGLVDVVYQAFDKNGNNRRWELCHRIDKDTSGCLVFASGRRALNHFQAQLNDDKIHKQYLALVKGRWSADHQVVDLDLDKKQTFNRNKSPIDEQQILAKHKAENAWSNTPKTQTAVSIFTTREKYRRMSLMQAVIKTGRTHQIRRHAASLGHPIAMDDKHGDFEWNKILKSQGLERLFLHAHIIKFESFEETIHVSAELPKDLDDFLEQFVIKV